MNKVDTSKKYSEFAKYLQDTYSLSIYDATTLTYHLYAIKNHIDKIKIYDNFI